MEQPCPRCGYVSDRPSRFCRQCGTPLFTESEASQAATRNYAPNQAAPAPPSYTPYQYPQSDDEPAPETTRFYRPPVASMPPEQPFPTAPPRAGGSHTGKILLIVLLCLLIIGGGVGVLMLSKLNDIVRGPQPRPEPVVVPPVNLPQPAPPAPPVPPSAPGAQTSGLEQYQYPGAKVTYSARMMGNDVLTLTTADNVAKVTEHYRKRFGNPMVESRDADGPNVVFEISGSPSAILTINSDKDEGGETIISIVATDFLPPKMKRK